MKGANPMKAAFTRRHAVAVGAAALLLLGGGFGTAAFADGPPGPAGPPAFAPHPNQATMESWSECTPSLCIDAPPEGPQGLDGSGGWGWDNSTHAPVTSLTVGTPAKFVVTVLQPHAACTPGSITLTYSSQDFSLSNTDSRGVIGTDPFARGGVEVFQENSNYFCHGAGSDSFTFTPRNPTRTALVTATVDVGGQQASETFPVAIVHPKP